ncbi:FeoB-associated Cys-rich membrane protein [Lactiplantibacillus plantarum]|uniref:FeoB-associated Cys-rich membrane protein n=1 Tax=Lactiplantibacillus plantarum TaxID=1590 RepID=UPI0009B5645F|nr:FeoB-associated Cys-rich membrane protein [Lactiplantibacillus plantarum]MCB7176903.1 FeoB-associated Cys-rich membrane protein [Lactiplantibacillus plantarum]
MALFVNFLIIALIIGAAGYQIYRVVKRAKKGKCAACDYDYEAKKMLNKAQKQQN